VLAAVPPACRSQRSYRSPADTNGQPPSALDLRRSRPSQVTILPDLALQERGQLVEPCIGLAVPLLKDGHRRAHGLNKQDAGDHYAGDQEQPRLYRGMSLAQTPPGLPLTRRLPWRGSLVGGSRRGSALPAKVRQAERRCPASGRAWSTFGPHAIGAERFVAVSSGASFAQVASVILGKRAQGLNPDKDEAAGSSPARPTTPRLT